jgi:signal peptidase I
MQDKIYSDYGLSFENTSNWNLRNGFTKGDIILVVAPENLNVGDVIVFDAEQRNPIIHRIINISNGVYTTKGDHNQGFLSYEKNISSKQIIGKAIFRIPLIGWVKLVFFDWRNPISQRGFCS